MPFAPNQTSFPVHVLYVLCCEHINPQTIGYSSPGVSYCSTVVSLKNKRPRGFDDLFIVVCNVIEKICVLIFAYQSCIYNTLILNLQVIPKLTWCVYGRQYAVKNISLISTSNCFLNPAGAKNSKRYSSLRSLFNVSKLLKFLLNSPQNSTVLDFFFNFEILIFQEFFPFSLTWDPMVAKISKRHSSFKSRSNVWVFFSMVLTNVLLWSYDILHFFRKFHFHHCDLEENPQTHLS